MKVFNTLSMKKEELEKLLKSLQKEFENSKVVELKY